MGAHSRACGENGSAQKDGSVLAGSSPRVRGKQLGAAHRVAAPGLIPACAGKTPTSPPDRTRSWAHPRACGENDAAAEGAWVPVGSSPRVRGKPVQVIPDIRLVGLIPARAGKTTAPPGADAHSTAHPRACGENCHEDRRRSRYGGSSPRVRGKLGGVGHCPEAGWLIPARAGKTLRPPTSGRQRGAHPRACGENRPRGDHEDSRPVAHPRACGENRTGVVRVVKRVGSSPHVRGKPAHAPVPAPPGGLIPARAGKT